MSPTRVPQRFSELFRRAEQIVSSYFEGGAPRALGESIEIRGERYVLMRAGALSVDFFDVVRGLYPDPDQAEALDVARDILFDVAHAMAMADARSFVRHENLPHETDRLAAGPFFYAHIGWASVVLLDESAPVAGPDYYVLYDHENSFEADSWIASGRSSQVPVCSMSAGYSSGWCESAYGMPLVAVEIMCRARGDECCRFIMAPPERIRERIDAYFDRHPGLAERNPGVTVPGFFSRKARAESLLADQRRLENLNARIIDALPGGLVHVRADGAILAANAKACHILGLTLNKLTGMYTADFDHQTIWEDGSPCDVADYPVTLALVTGEKQPPRTIGVVRPDGGVSWAVFTAVPVQDDNGATTGAVVTFLDITDRKAREQERAQFEAKLWQTQKLESLGVLAGGIAHDFNNLLTGVLANVSLVREVMAADDPARPLLEAAELAGARAAELTQQLLAYAGRGRTEKSHLCLSDVIGEMTHLLKAAVPRGVRFVLSREPDLPDVEADAGQIRQVVMNLITNAAESMSKAGGAVTLETRAVRLTSEELRELSAPPAVSAGDYVELRVADTGSGMSDETKARIFDPFFTTKFSGRGLGLAAILGIVRGHDGFINVESRPEHGTTMRVFLPSVVAPELPVPQPAAGGPVNLIGRNCLVIDDDEAARGAVVASLLRFGASVVQATDGEQGLRSFESQPFDLVVLDWTMPGLSGAEVLSRLRAKSVVPVLLISGYQDEFLQDLPGPATKIDFLQKPFGARDIADRVVGLLGAG